MKVRGELWAAGTAEISSSVSFCIWTVQPEPLAMAQAGLGPISPSLFLCGRGGMWVLVPASCQV